MHGIVQHHRTFMSSCAVLAVLLSDGAGMAYADAIHIHISIDKSTFGAANGYIDTQLSANASSAYGCRV